MEKRLNIKKWLLGTALLLISMLAGTSCVMDNDDLPDCPPPTPPSKDAPVVTAGLYCNEKLIAWEEGNAIGVYLIDNEKEALLQDSLGAPYILNDAEKGLFLPQWGISDQVISRPPLGAVYDALGIFPYGNALKDTKTANLSVADQSEPEKLDLFIPRRVHSITAETDTIHLDFYRRMSRLLFNLTMTEVSADNTETEANAKLAGASIQVNGLPVNGTFALESDKVETDDIQPFQAYMAENGQQGQAIVFPGTSTKDVRFLVSVPQYPDTLYSFVFSEEMILESCRTHTLALDMKYIHKPVIKQYDVKYRYEGAANKDNVTVTRGENLTAWGERDIIRLDENSDFTFQYQSSLKVSVRTEEGEVLPMSPGKPYTFQQIQKDITIIIYVEEDPGPGPGPGPDPEITHKVTYRYEGEANANNVTVFKGGMSNKWAQTETITVKDKEDFTFGFRSDMIVSVKTKDGETLSMGSGNPYTFQSVTKDIEIIIHAEMPEYAVKYVFEGVHTEGNVSVEKAISQGSFGSWGKTETVYVREGDDFTFKVDQNTNSDFPITISVKVKNQDVPKNSNGSYTLKSIYEDITVVISTNLHKVTYEYIDGANEDNVSVYKSSSFATDKKWTEKTEIIYVDHNANFTFGTDSRHELVVTENGTGMTAQSVSGEVTKNTFQLKNIQKDKKVIIGAKTEEDLLEHKVKYVLSGAAIGNTTVITSNEAWAESDAGVKTVADGGNFSFDATCQWNLTVTAIESNTGNSVAISNNGNSYNLSNIKKNVTVYISATTHTVSYTYSGKHVDANRVPILKGDNGQLWQPGAENTVTVDDNDQFTFKNNSTHTITVSGWGGASFTLKANESKTLTNITQDIQLIISADLVTVTYVLDGDTQADWLKVTLANDPNWATGDAGVQYIDKGNSFKFNCEAAKAGVAIDYVKDGETDVTHSGKAYTLSDVQTDKVIHIKAVKTHKVTYEVTVAPNTGTTKPSPFPVWQDNKNQSWQEGQTGVVTVKAGTDFVFGFNYNESYKVTVRKKGSTTDMVSKGTNEITYTEKDVQQDTHFIITLEQRPHVTIVCPSEIAHNIMKSGYVDYNTGTDEFIPTISDKKYIIVVTVKGDDNSSNGYTFNNKDNNKYEVTNITKDITITLTKSRKPADMPINADIHIWEELPAINGGIIYPTK